MRINKKVFQLFQTLAFIHWSMRLAVTFPVLHDEGVIHRHWCLLQLKSLMFLTVFGRNHLSGPRRVT